MQNSIIEIENLNLKIKDSDLLSGFSFQMKERERVGITGPSGCGKSTLLKSIVKGFFPDGSHVDRFQKNRALRYAYVPQTNGLLPWYSLRRNLDIFKRSEALYIETLEQFKLTDCIETFPHQLSGGEYQRSILASAIINQPDVFFSDEPLTELDIVNKWKLLAFWSEKIESSNAALLLISHDIETLLYLCDRIVVLSDKPANVLQEFEIDTPHVRDADFLVSESFIESKKQLLGSIQR
ncbi:MAG: ATP-binding cassette domain-containing protein [Tannerellaceae bacterium]|jgi:ABC-type nitrate/sulfonate/bicarbonate transport system ATPase subunit|nr:ATP-binding cassette domain-containing protein [Tannerellaceae bacterium]